ncbi:MAG: hypothetical protein ABIK26_03970, partial [Candidatus Omnitrophota bacterium]
FNVEKETGITDTLKGTGKITLTGDWEVNKQNEIIYTYEKSTRGKKEKITKAVTLEGYRDIAGKHRIIYVLNKEIESEFDFKVSVGKLATRSLEYEIGVAPSKKQLRYLVNQK